MKEPRKIRLIGALRVLVYLKKAFGKVHDNLNVEAYYDAIYVGDLGGLSRFVS